MNIVTKIIGYMIASFGMAQSMDDVYGLGCYLIEHGSTVLAH